MGRSFQVLFLQKSGDYFFIRDVYDSNERIDDFSWDLAEGDVFLN